MSQDQMTLPVGAMVQDTYGDRYQIKELLGRGGFGAVYLVNDRHFQEHEFALKELIEPSGHDHERLVFECEILKRLDHPALPRVYHVFEYEKFQRVYLLMEYIQGKNLEDLREEQPERRFPLRVALAIMSPIFDALTYLHQQEPPIVHRDIKPDNIIVPVGGEAVLVDFGTAKEFFSDATTTVFRHGSPGYAPIEQYSPGSRTNLRTDVYGLGATLYTLLTGVTPPDAIARITAENGADPLKPVHTLVPEIPRSVSNAISCALSIYNQHRFSSVAAFWAALHNDSFELPELTRSSSSLPETPLPALFGEMSNGTPLLLAGPKQTPFLKNKRVRAFALAILMLLALGLGSLGIFLSATHHTPTPSRAQSTKTQTPKVTASPSTTASPASDYPHLAQNYAGRIADSGVAGTVTNLYLTQITQDQQGNISGHFDGLYLAGPFTGTISKKGDLNFTMKITVGLLIVQGSIKVGGELQGTFKVVDPQGNSLGEYGVWTADPPKLS